MSDIRHYRGDTESRTLTIYDRVTKAPFDITDLIISLSIYKQPGGVGDEIINVTGIVQDAVGGSVSFSFTPEQANITGSYWYKVYAKSGNEQETLKYGRWNFV